MKRRKPTATKGLSSRKKTSVRLVERAPEVYLGPGAFEALRFRSGLLQGMQRPGRVDILEFQPVVERGYRRLIESRFSPSGDWDTVGIVLQVQKLHQHRTALIRDLVPGDVVLVCSEGDKKPVTYVNLGDELSPARLKISRRGTST